MDDKHKTAAADERDRLRARVREAEDKRQADLIDHAMREADLLREIDAAGDVLAEINAKLIAECGPPSDGHDPADEVIGLLRVTRSQRDTAEAEAATLRARVREAEDKRQAEVDAARAESERRGEALREILYERNGRWYVGKHGDTDVTEIVARAALSPAGDENRSTLQGEGGAAPALATSPQPATPAAPSGGTSTAALSPAGEGAVTAWRGEVCKRCWRRNVVGFHLPDATWNAVSRGRWNVLCPTCFDEEAEAAGVAYEFGELFPVTWSTL